MMSFKSTVKGIFAGRTPIDQLAQAEAGIETSQKQLDNLRRERPELVRQKMLGNEPAVARLRALDGAIEAEERRLRDWRDAFQATRSEMMARDADIRQREIEARPKRIAELVSERAKLTAETIAAMATVAAAASAFSKNSAELTGLLDIGGVNGFFSDAAFRSRLQAATARFFLIDPNGPLTARNSLLGIATNLVGPAARRTLADHEQAGLDDLAPFFLSFEEAAAARDRLKMRGTETMIVGLAGEVWTLVRSDQVFGRRQEAEAAQQRNERLTIVPANGGFVLLDRRFVGGEVA